MDGFFVLAADRKFSDGPPKPPDGADKLILVRRPRKRAESLSLDEITRTSIDDVSASGSSSRSARASIPSAMRENAKRSERKNASFAFT